MMRILLLLFITISSIAQNVTITPSGITPALSGISKLTYDEIISIPSPSNGDLAIDLTYKCLRIFWDGKWICSDKSVGDNSINVDIIDTQGSNSNDIYESRSIGIDSEGNIIVAWHQFHISIYPNMYIFVSKYNSDGVLLWNQSSSYVGAYNCYAYDLAIDGDDNIYVTGAFETSLKFGSITVNANGGGMYNSDIFIAKFSPNGTLQWLKNEGGSGKDIAKGIAIDSYNNVLVTGSFSGVADFSGTSKTALANTDIFVSKYSSSGSLAWVNSFGSSQEDSGNAVCTDTDGKVYATGFFKGSVNFGGQSRTSQGGKDIFVLKLASNGDFEWIQTGGSTGDETGNGIINQSNTNIFVTGIVNDTTQFTTGTILPSGISTAISNGGTDVFLAKYTSAGNLNLLTSFGGTRNDESNRVALDNLNNVLVAGKLMVASNYAFSDDAFIAKFNGDLSPIWTETFGGSKQEIAFDLAVNSFNILYFTGVYMKGAKFGNNVLTNASSYPKIFIGRLKE